MGILGIIIGFACLIILCYKNVNVYVVAVISSVIVILFNRLPFTDTLVNTLLLGAGTYLGQYIGLHLFGSILGKIYTYSGAAVSISKAILKALLRDGYSERASRRLAILGAILSGWILTYGGINAAIIVFTLYPIILSIFAETGIPKKYIVGTILGGSCTFALTGPGSPQPPNVVAMTVLNTPSTSGAIPGIIGGIVELIIIVFALEWLITRGIEKGETFAYGPKDVVFDDSKEKPFFVIALIPLVLIFVVFNIIKINLVVSLIIGCLSALILFWKYLGGIKATLSAINEGAMVAPGAMFSLASVVGFGMVVKQTEAFQQIVDTLLHLPLPPVILLIIAVGVLSLLTGGAAAGQQLALPVIAPSIISMGLPAQFIHRISCFTGSTLDTNPSSGTVIMYLNATDTTLKESYPAVFITTVLATSCGTAVVAIILSLFPMLA